MNFNEPKDYILKIKGHTDYLEGRITVQKIGQKYNSEINLVLVESGKIYKNIKNIYGIEDEDEIVRSSTQIIQDYLKSLRQPY